MLNIILKKYFSAASIPCCVVSSWSPEVPREGTFAPSEMEEPFAHSAVCFPGRGRFSVILHLRDINVLVNSCNQGGFKGSLLLKVFCFVYIIYKVIQEVRKKNNPINHILFSIGFI